MSKVVLSYDEESRLERARERAKSVDKLIGLRGKRVLEIGCSHGDFCKVLAEEYDCEVVGTEIIKQTTWQDIKSPNIKFFERDICKEPFPNNEFDRIVSFVVWEHMHHPWTALEACQRMLRPTGKKYLHAYLYGAPRLSHLFSEIPIPWLHLTQSPKEIMERLGKNDLPWYYWCNRLSYQHYLNYFRQLGFYVTYENLIRDKFDQEYYDANEKYLGMYPLYDLKTHGFQVVLEFDSENAKRPISDPVYSKPAR